MFYLSFVRTVLCISHRASRSHLYSLLRHSMLLHDRQISNGDSSPPASGVDGCGGAGIALLPVPPTGESWDSSPTCLRSCWGVPCWGSLVGGSLVGGVLCWGSLVGGSLVGGISCWGGPLLGGPLLGGLFAPHAATGQMSDQNSSPMLTASG